MKQEAHSDFLLKSHRCDWERLLWGDL